MGGRKERENARQGRQNRLEKKSRKDTFFFEPGRFSDGWTQKNARGVSFVDAQTGDDRPENM
jgi:hypothetical protein